MKSTSYLGLALGMIVLLSNQAHAGEVTEWVHENNAAISTTGLYGGAALFVVSGVGTDKAADMMFNATKRLGSPEERGHLANQVKEAELEYQAVKAKLNKIIADSREQSKSSKVISLDAVRQRKIYEQAEEKYKHLQARYVSLEKRIGREAVTSPHMIKTAEKDLKRAKTLSKISYMGLATSIPVIVVPGTVSAIISNRMEKKLRQMR